MGTQKRERLFVPVVVLMMFKESFTGQAMLAMNHATFRGQSHLCFNIIAIC